MASPGKERQEFARHKMLSEIMRGKVSKADGYRMGKNWAQRNWTRDYEGRGESKCGGRRHKVN